MTVLEVNNIHKRFGKTDVLKGIDFKIEEGEVVSVIGSSGQRQNHPFALHNRT